VQGLLISWKSAVLRLSYEIREADCLRQMDLKKSMHSQASYAIKLWWQLPYSGTSVERMKTNVAKISKSEDTKIVKYGKGNPKDQWLQ
jgi:hypothetical protein